MLSPLQRPTKEVDVEFLIFVQRYATDLLKWDILSFFAHHPDFCATIPELAHQIGRSAHSILPDVGDLTILGILEQVTTGNHHFKYRLTTAPTLRKMTLKFADQLTPHHNV